MWFIHQRPWRGHCLSPRIWLGRAVGKFSILADKAILGLEYADWRDAPPFPHLF